MSSRLECKNLTKDYGNVMALSDVNLTLESGRIVGLLGPNGSGGNVKTVEFTGERPAKNIIQG